jgi:lysophospholipase L1-like esterase
MRRIRINQANFFAFATGFIAALAFVTVPRWFTYVLRSSSNVTAKRKKVVFFGDSITQHGFNNKINGWVSSMANWWTRRVDVLNRGFSGYNSAWGRSEKRREDGEDTVL